MQSLLVAFETCTSRFLIVRWNSIGTVASLSGYIVDRITHDVAVANLDD
jgi:hypothetical protein